MNAPGTLKKIPGNHLPKVMNSLLCEHLLGFERRLDESGQHVWRGTKSSGEITDWSPDPFDFAGDLKEAQDLIQQYCRQARLGYNFVYDPRSNKHTVFMLEVGPQGQPIPRVNITGDVLSQLICAAIIGMNQLDLEAQHRELFPGHYILLNN